MNIEIPLEMLDFIIQHFKKRIEYRKKTLPNFDLVDSIAGMIDWGLDEKEARQKAIENKKKTLEFIHNARLVIDLIEKATAAKR